MSALHESQTATADANGRAVARLTPLRAFENWKIKVVSVSSTSTLVPRADVYIGGESPSNFHSGTYAGTRDSNNDVIDLENGTHLIVVWTGCTPGASCSVTVRGEKVGR